MEVCLANRETICCTKSPFRLSPAGTLQYVRHGSSLKPLTFSSPSHRFPVLAISSSPALDPKDIQQSSIPIFRTLMALCCAHQIIGSFDSYPPPTDLLGSDDCFFSLIVDKRTVHLYVHFPSFEHIPGQSDSGRWVFSSSHMIDTRGGIYLVYVLHVIKEHTRKASMRLNWLLDQLTTSQQVRLESELMAPLSPDYEVCRVEPARFLQLTDRISIGGAYLVKAS